MPQGLTVATMPAPKAYPKGSRRARSATKASIIFPLGSLDYYHRVFHACTDYRPLEPGRQGWAGGTSPRPSFGRGSAGGALASVFFMRAERVGREALTAGGHGL